MVLVHQGPTTEFEPFLLDDPEAMPSTPLGYSEVLIQAHGTLREARSRVGAALQVLLAVNVYFKTTLGKVGFCSVTGHTGFDDSNPASMATLQDLERIEKAVRTQPGFVKAFPLVLSKNTTVSLRGMRMVGTLTGRAGEQEASRSSDAKVQPKFATMASETHNTAKSSTTSAFLGQHPGRMDGVVFKLRTNIDNSNGGTCVWINGVTNTVEHNTVLRLLSEQERLVDMSK